MLFPYHYVSHSMEKMQEIIDFIFKEVWCNAPHKEYGLHLFKSIDVLYQIINELNKRDLAGKLKDGAGKWFYESVNEIFNEFKKLSNAEIELYRQMYEENNMIEELCSNSSGISPVRYCDLNSSYIELNRKLRDFYQKLYSSGFFGLSFVTKAVGSDLDAYYKEFIKNNNTGSCPFCGLNPLDNCYDPTREAFDHYLPKSKYPFNSVNLKNLAPSCCKCNASNKNDKDPLYDDNCNRRKAYFPFSKTHTVPQIKVDVLCKDWLNPDIDDFEITITSTSHSEEVETWNDLFRIKERYRARCYSESGGKYWQIRILEEHANYGLSIREMVNVEIQSANNKPWVDSNFLKKAFLEGCDRAHLFNTCQ